MKLYLKRISDTTEHHLIKISKMRRYLYRDWCEIILDQELEKGVIYVLKLKFHGNLTTGETGPFYRVNYDDNETEEPRWYLATDLQSKNARRLFPCFDELNLKATFQISVYRPAKFKALSTTACELTEVIDDTDWAVDHFNTTPPMATESLALIIFDPYSLQSVNPMKIWKSATVHGYVQSHFVDIYESDVMYQFIRMLQVIDHYVGMSFPLPDLYIMALPKYHKMRANSYWGLIMFSEEELENGFVNYQLMQAITTQWMGHFITPHSRSRMDFNNGVAQYLTHIGLTFIEKNPKYENLILWGPAFSSQAYYTYSKINGRDDELFKEVRTARLCQMLNFTLTERTFRAALHNFLDNRAFQTYTENHFFKILDQQAWLDATLPSSTSAKDIARSWIKKDHFPVVTVTRNYINHTAKIEQHAFIREWPYQTYETTESLWWIPILYLSRYNLDLDYLLILTWLREEGQITIGNLPDQETFIIINPEDIGMFLVNYDHTNWELLSQYLDKSPLINGRALIPTKTRSKLLCDAIYLALSGELDFPTALDMTLFVRYEKETSVWTTMLTLYEVIYHELLHGSHDTAVLDKFGAYVAYLLTPAYKSLQEESLETKGKKKSYTDLQVFLSHVGYKPVLEESRLHLNLEMVYNSSSERKKLGGDLEIFSLMFIDDTQQIQDDEIRNVLSSVTDYYTFIKFIANNWDIIKESWEAKMDLWNSILQTATQNFRTRYGFSLVSELYQNHKTELGSARRIVENSLYTVSEKMNGQYKFIRHMSSWLDQHLLLLPSQDIPASHFMSTHIVY
ncbi:aminopeptidase N isoform X2 [Anabrus simplex]|uniref:aminopeptidase N isoform X2 n=1 Tax=Anabrus simplex TaxID=316456 RepID=UPI0035A2F5F8